MDGNFKYWMGIWEPAISVICHKGAAPCLLKKNKEICLGKHLYTHSHTYIFSIQKKYKLITYKNVHY